MSHKHTKIILLIALIVLLALPAAAAVPPGRISVYSTPSGAHVCVDNTNCDTTPATFIVEGNAWHMAVVTEAGYRDWTDTVYVTSDMTNTVTAYLDQDPAATAIHVNLTPGGGTVCLDNSQCRSDVGTVNSTGSTVFTGVSPGYHTVSVDSPPGYVNTQKLVEVNLGKITRVNITLDAVVFTPTPTLTPLPETGMVRVYVDRTGSTVCLDNSRCVYNLGGDSGQGTGTMVFDRVIANETHIVTVAADGYEPFSATVMVGRDLISTVDVTLRPMIGARVTTLSTTASMVATTIPSTVTTVPPTMPPSRSPAGIIPVIGALLLCGTVFLLRKNRK